MNRQQTLNNGLVRTKFCESDEPQASYTPHCHDQYEIYCFLSGLADFRIAGLPCGLAPGSVLLVESGRFHSVQALAALGQPYRRAVVQFSAQALTQAEQYLLGLFRRPEILYPGAWQNGIESAFQALAAAADLPQTVREMAVHTRLMALLVDLFAISGSAVAIQPRLGRVQPVLAYLDANLTNPVTLEELAERFGFSRNGLARAFKRATGTTVADYLLYKRMAMARTLLRAGHPAGVAAKECGYGEYSTFYRCYCRVYGLNPAADGSLPPPGAPQPDAMA